MGTNMDKFNEHHLVSIARAYGALLMKHTRFMDALSNHVSKCLTPPFTACSFKPSHLTNIAYTFATLRIPCKPMMKKMIPIITQNTDELRPGVLARCARAYSLLSVHNSELMVAVVGEAVKKLPEFRTRDLQRFIDALFTSTALQGGRQIETELASRIERFGQALCNVSSIDRLGV